MSKIKKGREAANRPTSILDDAPETLPGPSERFWPHVRGLDWSTVALILAVKFLIFVFAVHSYNVLANADAPGLYGFFQIWNQWDAPHYLDIARNGYVTTGEERFWIAFYPLYPWLVRWFAFFLRDHLISALVVSGLASIAAGLLLQRLVEFDYERATARMAVWFLLIFPTSYFLHIGYTESLFLALSVGCFLAARTNRWALAGVIGALACLTRVNGLVLIPALAAEAFWQYRATRRLDPRWLWAALPSVGFGIYLLINQRVHGNPFYFQEVMREHWHKTLTGPWVGIGGAWESAWWRAPAEGHMVGLQEFSFMMLGLACTVWCFMKLRPSYGVWMAGNWLLLTSTSFVLSAPRYTLVLFPIYILFARFVAPRPVWNGVVTVWSLLYMALFIGQFVQGRWAF